MWEILSRYVKITWRFTQGRSPWTLNDWFCFLAGRGQKSHAYTHSVQFTHHVFLNLHTLKFYCLPDNYEIIDSSLEDITVSTGMLVVFSLFLSSRIYAFKIICCYYWGNNYILNCSFTLNIVFKSSFSSMFWSQLSLRRTLQGWTSRVNCTEPTMVQPTCQASWGLTTSKPTTTPMWCYRYVRSSSHGVFKTIAYSLIIIFVFCELPLSRLFPMFHLCETTSWRRKTTRGSADHQGTSCFSWSRGSVSWCANFGIQETSRLTCLPTRCCKLLCCAARRLFKLPSKVDFPPSYDLHCTQTAFQHFLELWLSVCVNIFFLQVTR